MASRSYFEWSDDLHNMDLDEYLEKWRGVEKPKKEGFCPEFISIMGLMTVKKGEPSTDQLDHVTGCSSCQALMKSINSEFPNPDLGKQLLKEVHRHYEGKP